MRENTSTRRQAPPDEEGQATTTNVRISHRESKYLGGVVGVGAHALEAVGDELLHAGEVLAVVRAAAQHAKLRF